MAARPSFCEIAMSEETPAVRDADDALPPVQPPTAAFLLQLFFIPMIIVSVIILVWGLFSWLAHMGSDPRDLVNDLKAMNDASWQRAYQLAEQLRNPENDALKDDQELADDLVAVLDAQLDAARTDQSWLNMRIYLCRALGEFRVPSVAPVLARAAEQERFPEELAVRRTAVEGLAALAGNVGGETLREQPEVMRVLMAASRERTSPDSGQGRDELRSAAAFALGAVGGEEALQRLAEMLRDPFNLARYNAATGLARYADVRANDVLVEMLDVRQLDVGANAEPGALQVRYNVMANGILAASRMVHAPADAPLDELKAALRAISEADVPRAIQLHATEALQLIEQRRAAA